MAFTYFFRDAESLELALDHAMPRMIGQSFIHIWDAGCAHGPETYTLAMLLRERMSDFVFRNVRIHATDIEPSGLFARKVTDGVYPEEELRRLPSGFREKYFHRLEQPGQFQVVEQLRAKIHFAQHDLLSLVPVREGITMIVCKNVLLHLEPAQRVEVLRMFHAALRPDGLLVLEQTQKIPELLAGCFQPVVSHAQVLSKVERTLVEHPAQSVAPHTVPAHGFEEKKAVSWRNPV
jgi:chemotaxis protein methyltransferase CheR